MSRGPHQPGRRDFLRSSFGVAGAAVALSALPPAIRKALAIEAHNATKSIEDVQHVVILMQENRSFDHYFGMLRGVRGYGDRFPIPLEGGKSVWYQKNADEREITPFHLDPATMNSALIVSTPHNFPDAQAAWNQGKFGHWPKYKLDVSMGYHLRDGAPFQWALADAFTICDAYHCSIQTGTDPNRIVFWSGSNHDPVRRDQGLGSDQSNAEAVNLRCWITGEAPDPGYTYYGSDFTWKCIPEVLQDAGVSWRIYQNVNDNWMGAMNGALAFKGLREARPGSPLYENALRTWTLEDLRNDVIAGRLPSVSWICPSQMQSEHPGAPASPERGAFFTQQVLEALTASADSWSKTVLFITFDENDGLFDHMPPPAIPSINADGTPAGKSTVEVAGLYFEDPGVPYDDILYARFGLPPSVSTYPLLDPRDTISGARRPWGMGPRVPMYVVSPWSRGGWVNSQVFDHTSVGRFLETRFGVTIPAISEWARAVAGDLSTAFDFVNPNDPTVPTLPDQSHYQAREDASRLRPAAAAPASSTLPKPETGTRPSRALPYELHTSARADAAARSLQLLFSVTGTQGAVFHVYDRLHLDRIPRRYTVEAGKTLDDTWSLAADTGRYDLEVHGPNGYFRGFKGDVTAAALPEVRVCYDVAEGDVYLSVRDDAESSTEHELSVDVTAYRSDGPWRLTVRGSQEREQRWSLADSARWYDFTVACASLPGYERRFAGRVETGEHGVSDPAMGG